MTSQEIRDALTGVVAGTKLRLTFNAGSGKKGFLDGETKAAVCYFVMMKDANIIFPDEMDWAVMYAVGLSGYWDHDSNRIVEVLIPEGFNLDWFSQRLEGGLEKLEVIG